MAFSGLLAHYQRIGGLHHAQEIGPTYIHPFRAFLLWLKGNKGFVVLVFKTQSIWSSNGQSRGILHNHCLNMDTSNKKMTWQELSMIHITDMYLHTLLQLRIEGTDGPPIPCVYISRISTYYVNYVCTYIRTYIHTYVHGQESVKSL